MEAGHVAFAGHMTRVKAVITAFAIYHLTPLNLSVEVLRKIDRLRRVYLWAGSDTVTAGSARSIGRKCPRKWLLGRWEMR